MLQAAFKNSKCPIFKGNYLSRNDRTGNNQRMYA